MPRLRIPGYLKHKTSGQAFVKLNGQFHYLGPYGTKASRREYDRLISEWTSGGRRLPSLSYDITIIELADAYLAWAECYYQRNGLSTGVTPAIKCALRYLIQYSDLPASEFGPLKLEALRDRMVADGKARRYCNQHCDWIKRCFKWGASKELVQPDVYRALSMLAGLRRGKTVAHETAPIQPVCDEDVEAVLPHLPEVVRDMVQLQRFTGMRPGELVIMRPADVDRSDADVWLYRPTVHKNLERGKGRTVAIGPQGQAALAKYLLRPGDDYCFKPNESEARRLAELHQQRKTPMCCGNRPGSNRKAQPKRTAGKSYSTQSYGRAIQRACDLAGVTRWAPNRLRHSVGTLVRKEYGIESAQAVLGHSSLQTSQIYAEVNLQRACEFAKKLG